MKIRKIIIQAVIFYCISINAQNNLIQLANYDLNIDSNNCMKSISVNFALNNLPDFNYKNWIVSKDNITYSFKQMNMCRIFIHDTGGDSLSTQIVHVNSKNDTRKFIPIKRLPLIIIGPSMFFTSFFMRDNLEVKFNSDEVAFFSYTIYDPLGNVFYYGRTKFNCKLKIKH